MSIQRLGRRSYVYPRSGGRDCRLCGDESDDERERNDNSHFARRRFGVFVARHESGDSSRRKSFARASFQLDFVDCRRHYRVCRHDSRGFRAGFDRDCAGNFRVFFVWFAPKVFRAVRKLFNGIRALFAGENFQEVARKAS